MELFQSHRAEMISIAVALVAIAAGTSYYYYLTKKPKGVLLTSYAIMNEMPNPPHQAQKDHSPSCFNDSAIESHLSTSCLDPECFKEFKLVKRIQLSHNVAKFRFSLPKPNSVLGLPIGQHMSCRGKDALGEEVTKPYTPTTLDSDVGYFELVIKMYPQGRMSHYFREMCEGDYLAVKGPKGRFKYQPNQVRAFGMLAGGTGITPMFQVTRAILEDSNDKTNVHLIYANVTHEDILLKEELDNLASNFPNRFSVYYVLNQPPEGWDGGIGFVSKEMIQTFCPAPAPDIQILRCGPPPMNRAMAAILGDLGYAPEMQFQF